MSNRFYRNFGKRMLDVAAALLLLPLVLLAVVFVAPLTWLSDRGPVLYMSTRRGRNGRHFSMYKFRSMKVDAPDVRNADGSTVNSDDDPRVTKIGRLLRLTSVDELPQVWNVLRGDMSFVGPRPNMTRQSWDELTPIERKRVVVRPGITGLAQARHRNAATTAMKYRIDAEYVDHVSFALDARIIGWTVRSVVRARNVNTRSAPESSATQ